MSKSFGGMYVERHLLLHAFCSLHLAPAILQKVAIYYTWCRNCDKYDIFCFFSFRLSALRITMARKHHNLLCRSQLAL